MQRWAPMAIRPEFLSWLRRRRERAARINAGLHIGVISEMRRPPRRIVIVGSPGSGKSTLARTLGVKLALPVVHLDVLHYLPGWKRADLADFRARVSEAHRGDEWISEGNFASWTFERRLPRAEALRRAGAPALALPLPCRSESGLGRRNRPDLPLGCPEQIDRDLLDFIWRYSEVGRPEFRPHAASKVLQFR